MEIILGISLFSNIGLAIYLITRKRPLKKEPEMAQDARQLLHDLTKGAALVRIEALNPDDFYMRRTF